MGNSDVSASGDSVTEHRGGSGNAVLPILPLFPIAPLEGEYLADDALTHISRRAATDADYPLLHALYATTRAEEMAVVPWTEAEKTAFVEMQFHAQDTDYRRNHPDGRFDVLEWDGVCFGRLYVDATDSHVNIMEITLAPDWRGRGIGTAILCELIADADARRQKCVLYVEPQNPAMRLYARMGFVVTNTDGYYWRMERAATAGA